MKTILFDKSAKQFILSSFNKSIDKEGYIIEDNAPDQKVLAQDGEEVLVNDFAGLKKGSEVFIKKDLSSLLKLVDSIK